MDPFAILAIRRAPEPDQHPRPLWGPILFVMMLLSVAVAAFGPELPEEPVLVATATPDRDGRDYTVAYRFEVFSPTNLRIRVGDSVRFVNDSATPIRIIADVPAGKKIPEFDSGSPVQPGTAFTYTFATAGVFGYHNGADPNQAGVIIVRE